MTIEITNDTHLVMQTQVSPQGQHQYVLTIEGHPDQHAWIISPAVMAQVMQAGGSRVPHALPAGPVIARPTAQQVQSVTGGVNGHKHMPKRRRDRK